MWDRPSQIDQKVRKQSQTKNKRVKKTRIVTEARRKETPRRNGEPKLSRCGTMSETSALTSMSSWRRLHIEEAEARLMSASLFGKRPEAALILAGGRRPPLVMQHLGGRPKVLRIGSLLIFAPASREFTTFPIVHPSLPVATRVFRLRLARFWRALISSII